MAFLREKCAGRLFVRMRGAAAPIDLAYALRGENLFYDMYDEPEALKALLRECARAAAWWMDEQYRAADHVAGGVISGYEVWLPGRWFGHLSEDATVLCAREKYLEFGRPFTERALAGFEGAFVHTHTAGAHALPDIAGVSKYRVMEISSDPKTPRAIDVYEALFDALSEKTVVLAVTPGEIRDHLSLLRRSHAILWLDADTLAEAEDAVALIRAELPVRA